MAKGYLRQAWTNPATGEEFGVNDQIEFDTETPEGRVSYDHLVASGIIGKRALGEENAAKAEESGDSPAVSTRPDPAGKGKSGRTSTTPAS